MGTTNLFVELIVIGTGVAIWLVLLTLTIFGYEWVMLDAKMLDSSFVAVFSLIIVYVFGILFDRFANLHFKDKTRLGGWINRRAFRKDKAEKKPPFPFKEFDECNHAKAIVYSQLESLRDTYEYNRTRLRICRGWALNCILIFFALNLFVWTRVPGNYPRLVISLSASSLLLVMTFAAIQGWAELTINENKNLSLHKNIIETLKKLD